MTTDTDALARIDEYETALLAEIRDLFRAGHRAVGLSIADPDRHVDVGRRSTLDGWRVDVDADVTASVDIFEGTEEHSTTQLLSDVPGLATAGVLQRVACPLQTPFWLASAVDEKCRFVTVRDASRIGTLATSRAGMPTGRTAGEWAQEWWQRSGVPEVNERRQEANRMLFQEYGERKASQIAMGARVETIIGYLATAKPPLWTVWAPRGELVRSAEPPRMTQTLADAIVDAFCIDAYGAKRPHLPTAKAWSLRWVEEDETEAGDEWAPKPLPGVVFEKDLSGHSLSGAPSGPARIQLMSDWTLIQGSENPTCNQAIAQVDGQMTVGGALATEVGTAELVESWQRAGLTGRQIACLGLHQLGFDLKAIGEVIRRHVSVVSRELTEARRKLA